ncbi:MAG: hypothetical protein ACK559_04380, partial [bacterium]
GGPQREVDRAVHHVVPQQRGRVLAVRAAAVLVLVVAVPLADVRERPPRRLEALRQPRVRRPRGEDAVDQRHGRDAKVLLDHGAVEHPGVVAHLRDALLGEEPPEQVLDLRLRLRRVPPHAGRRVHELDADGLHRGALAVLAPTRDGQRVELQRARAHPLVVAGRLHVEHGGLVGTAVEAAEPEAQLVRRRSPEHLGVAPAQ